jgi:hypothetical protein
MKTQLTNLILGLACTAIVGLCSPAAAQANPGLPFYGYGSIVATPAYPVVGENTHITVAVGNSGPATATNVQVRLSFNDWGVTFMGWQEIGTTTLASIPAGGTVTAAFDHVFITRTHTCLEALIVGADDNTDPNDDRGQINLEVINAGETFSYGVPVVNNGDGPLDLLVLGHARGGADGTVGGVRAEPIDVVLHLEAGGMAIVPVVIDLGALPLGAVVEYQVDAFDLADTTLSPNGHEHVLLRVVKTTARANKAYVTAQMTALAAGLPRGAAANQFRTAVKHLQTALEPRLWIDANHVRRGSGAEVFAMEGFFDRKATDVLPLLPESAKVAVEGALRTLMDCDRILAQTAVADAGGPPAARALLAQADELRLNGDGNAIRLYRQAWQAATR